MKKLAMTAGGLAAGALLVGTLAAPAVAAGPHPDPHYGKDHKCVSERDVSSAVVDFAGSPLFGTVFSTATNRRGQAFLNDSRVPGAWINLNLIPGGPRCTTDTAVSVTEGAPGRLIISLLAESGVIYRTTCVTSAVPFTSANLAAACSGFTNIGAAPRF
ncbi:hypothetical protein [Streptomyces sp. HUAS ZL42]|uniref:hypothetical protein n=1 Tax=Streptomyces sp. HUAS ZL42 TaxID=3231715 RepID=UPI00345E9E40